MAKFSSVSADKIVNNERSGTFYKPTYYPGVSRSIQDMYWYDSHMYIIYGEYAAALSTLFITAGIDQYAEVTNEPSFF